MAEKPQFYQEVQWANTVDTREQKLKSVVKILEDIKVEFEGIKTAVDADAGSTPDMITLANQANNLVNHASYTGFITFMNNALA